MQKNVFVRKSQWKHNKSEPLKLPYIPNYESLVVGFLVTGSVRILRNSHNYIGLIVSVRMYAPAILTKVELLNSRKP